MLRGAVLLQRSARTVMARCHWSNPSLVVVPKLWNPQQQQHQRRRGCSSSSSARKALEPDEDESSELWEARLTKALQQLDDCTVGTETTWTAPSLLEEVRDCYVSLGRLEDAMTMEMKLLELAKDQREQADCYHRLGSLQLQMQHFADARRYYQLALALFYEIHGKDSFHREMGKLLVGLGGICVHQGDPERALPLLAQAEEHYRQHGRRVTDPVIMDSSITSDDDDIDGDDGPHPEISVVLGNQALIHRMMGQHQVAIEKYKEMLVFLDQYESHNEEKKHEVQLQIADCLFAVNQLGPALDHFQILLDNLKSRRGDEETAQEGVLRYHIGVIHSKQVRNNPLGATCTTSCSTVVKVTLLRSPHIFHSLFRFCSYYCIY